MNWGYPLLGTLVLLFPGLCAWLGLRSGSRIDYLSPLPDRPNSTSTLFVILAGALLAHVVGAGLFAVQELYCRRAPCLRLPVDPNVYKAMLRHDQVFAGTSTAIALALLFFTLLGLLSAASFQRVARSVPLSAVMRPELHGWVRMIAAGTADPDRLVIASVLTRTGHNGRFAGYEGIVHQFTLDEDEVVAMIVLAEADRFLIEIGDTAASRHHVEDRSMSLVQLQQAEIANVAFDVIDLRALRQPA
ncbi:hypothetical protein KZ820_11970 [Sphingomonas sp. RRHST34]|uniref:Uncharacterized protein n=1 Tax=Sphingomonas citri TaxID=2862499 RepID=A0ABS7BPB2_9SPHN|nr:hypothetical protein [Sphingomonas citri]MBW6531452.1 hypothetical protein [Sphingomonas citri]